VVMGGGTPTCTTLEPTSCTHLGRCRRRASRSESRYRYVSGSRNCRCCALGSRNRRCRATGELSSPCRRIREPLSPRLRIGEPPPSRIRIGKSPPHAFEFGIDRRSHDRRPSPPRALVEPSSSCIVVGRQKLNPDSLTG
jgi:hypothetical protein